MLLGLGLVFDPAAPAEGLRLKIADYRRPDPRTAPTEKQSETQGYALICTIGEHKAEREGYNDALMLDWRGQIAEATGANILLSERRRAAHNSYTFEKRRRATP